MFRPLLIASSCLVTGLESAAPPGRAHRPAAHPSRRAHHALVYDAVNARVLLAGGSTPVDSARSFVFFGDLWALTGSRWMPLDTSGEKLSGSALAYDVRRQRVVAFGGYNGASMGALRTLERSSWRTIGQHPELRTAEPGFVYDARRDRFVAFGGSASPTLLLGETWEWDGNTWSHRETATTPAARQAAAMVYDGRRGVTVLFGGMGQGPPGSPPPPLGDTWEFDGQTWSERQVDAAPSPRISPGATYDSKRGTVIVFGGLSKEGFKGDTWSWDGTSWQRLAEDGPPPRVMGHLAYDERRDRVVLFGGRRGWPDGDLDDTWEWDGTSWREIPAGYTTLR